MAAALAAVLPVALAVPAHAADAVDQSLVMNPPRSWQTNLPELAQTFTAGVTAQVDRVSLQASTLGGFSGITVTLQDVAADGTPGPKVLGTATNPLSMKGSGQVNDFTFSRNVGITAGTHYAIVVQVWAGTFTWYDSGSADLYKAGSAYVLGRIWSVNPNHLDFGFEDWVVTSTAPGVAADKGTVSMPESSTPTNAPLNTGTCSAGVALSASSGTVTKACTGGVWSWTPAASDEGTQTIVITADAGQGLTSTTSFTLNVTKVAPTATILTDPLSVPEGTSVPFTGGATTPFAPDSAGLVLGWTVTKSGSSSPYATGSGTAFSFTPADDGIYDVTFSATDDGGMTGTSSMTVTATNVAPSPSITGVTGSVPLVTAPGETLTFSGTFTDADTADAYTITWNFGDGTTAAGRTVTHAFAAARSYTVTFQVSDGEGGVGTATTTVTVQTTQQALTSIASFVQNLPGLNPGQKNSLIAKLNAASDAAARGNTTAAHNQLNAFLNELQADVNTGRVSSVDAGALRSAVHAIQGALGTYNRFLEWWPLES